ncbi:hypothetical protein CRD60_06430, partial [Bifidobacterium aemilianum]
MTSRTQPDRQASPSQTNGTSRTGDTSNTGAPRASVTGGAQTAETESADTARNRTSSRTADIKRTSTGRSADTGRAGRTRTIADTTPAPDGTNDQSKPADSRQSPTPTPSDNPILPHKEKTEESPVPGKSSEADKPSGQAPSPKGSTPLTPSDKTSNPIAPLSGSAAGPVWQSTPDKPWLMRGGVIQPRTGCAVGSSPLSDCFPDTNLALAMAQTLHGNTNVSQTLTSTDITTTNILNLNNKGISNIEGLQRFTRLTSLDLGSNDLRDGSLAPLGTGSLTLLARLCLDQNHLTDL